MNSARSRQKKNKKLECMALVEQLETTMERWRERNDYVEEVKLQIEEMFECVEDLYIFEEFDDMELVARFLNCWLKENDETRLVSLLAEVEMHSADICLKIAFRALVKLGTPKKGDLRSSLGLTRKSHLEKATSK